MLCIYFQSPATSSFLGPNATLSGLFLKTTTVSSVLIVRYKPLPHVKQ